VARRHGLALHAVRLGQHLAHGRDAGLDRPARAAGVLHDEGAQPRVFLELLFLQQRADLVALAAETDDETAGEVRVPRVAAERAAQEVHRLAGLFHAAAGAVREGDDPVDVREVREAFRREPLRDPVHDGRGAVHRREHADEVARAHLPVRADDALEGRALRLGDHLDGPVVGAGRVVAVELPELDVVRMDVAARCDVGGGEADDHVVLPDRLALRDRARRDLVTGGHLSARRHVLRVDAGTERDFGAGDDDVVGLVQADGDAGGVLFADLDHGGSGDDGQGPDDAIAGPRVTRGARRSARSAASRPAGSAG
jgi:hypothetical protein